MNWQTKKKAEEIQKMLSEGCDLKEILQVKFNRSVAKLKEHIEMAKELYSELELKILEGKESFHSPVKKVFHAPSMEIFPPEKMKALEDLLNHSDELLSLLNNKNNLQSEDIINHLLIPDEYLQIADIKVKSIRISEDVEGKFNKFCDKFKQYSKTSMLNYALIEFMEKYKG